MRLDLSVHRERPWRVHTLCADFTLLDVWRVPIDGDPARDRFEDFVRAFVANGVRTSSGLANALFSMRWKIGAVMGWDDDEPIAIPGCTETTVVERFTDEDRARNRPLELPEGQPTMIRPAYMFEDEALLEIVNKTIHALAHLGWVDHPDKPGHETGELAVYIKSRGAMSNAYMAAIGPFRHWLVYPPLIASVCETWEKRAR